MVDAGGADEFVISVDETDFLTLDPIPEILRRSVVLLPRLIGPMKGRRSSSRSEQRSSSVDLRRVRPCWLLRTTTFRSCGRGTRL